MQKSDSPPASVREGLAVVYRPPSALRRYEHNARTHSPEQVEQIAASILEFGFNAPILLRDDETTIGAGHGRQAAAELILSRGQALPTPDGVQVPTITLTGLTDAQWRAYVLADNQLATTAGWDEAILQRELQAILDAEPELGAIIGFDQAEMDRILGVEIQPASGLNGGGSFNYQEQFGVIVVCTDEASQKAAFDALTESGYDCRVVVT